MGNTRNRQEQAIFGAGCFWGVEAYFRRLPGVVDVEVGYCGGAPQGVSYDQVCSGATGHAEVVKMTFDPGIVRFSQLLEAFFACHDPTQKDRQGPDVGRQYRSVIFPLNQQQAEAARHAIQSANAENRRPRPIATTIEAPVNYTRAEAYHQRYLEKHGG